MSQKYTKAVTNMIVKPFHHPSTLLYLFEQAIGRGEVGHDWMVVPAFASQDQYASKRSTQVCAGR